MKILLVEDDKCIAGFISKGLKQEGFSIAHALNGMDGYLLASTEKFDVAIVDIMLPEIDGLTLIDKLRGRKITMPILVLSAKKTVDDKIKGLKAGGDDYMTKPFAFSELVARLKALIRRAVRIMEPIQLVIGNLSLDTDKREVKCEEKKIELQPLEFDLLKYLLKNSGKSIAPENIDNVFKRFYRCDESRSKQGHGLGLSLTAAIVKAHNGTISVKSKINEYTSFIVDIPLF